MVDGAKGQSAIELLTTYSWAFLIIAVFIAVVFLLATNTNTQNNLPSSCTVTPLTVCQDSYLSSIGGVTTFEVQMRNNYGISLYFPPGTNSMSIYLGYSGAAYPGQCTPTVAIPGSLFTCIATANNYSIPIGTSENVNFNIDYKICENGCLTNSSTPANILYEVPITITNPLSSYLSLQTAAINIDSKAYSAYEANNLQNVEFFYPNGTIIKSWLEHGNSNTSTSSLYWLGFGVPSTSSRQLSPSQSFKIYMGFAPTNTNLFDGYEKGEAPNLSPTWNEYDNGPDVFPFFWVPPSGISEYFGGPSYTTNPFVLWTSNSFSGISLVTSSLATYGTIDGYGGAIANGNYQGYLVYQAYSPSYGYEDDAYAIGSSINGTSQDYSLIDLSKGTSAQLSPSVSTGNYVMSLYVCGTEMCGQLNYGKTVTLGGTVPTNFGVIVESFTKSTSPLTLQWVRTRGNTGALVTIGSSGVPLSLQPTYDTSGTAISPTQNFIPIGSGLLYALPITLTNTQSSATPSPMQYNLTFDSATYKAYETGNLMNIAFYYANGTVIPSWLEGGNLNTSTSTKYWLRINPSIASDNSIIVYMGFAPFASNLFNNASTGENPYLSSTYGKFDDGADVFNYYWSWGGTRTSLPSGWSSFGSISSSGCGSSGYDFTSLYTELCGSTYGALSSNVLIPVGAEPESIVLNPAGTVAYTANYGSNNVSVVNLVTNTVTASIKVNEFPEDIAINPAGTLLYVPSWDNGTVSVISTASDTVIGTIKSMSSPISAAFSPNGAYAYILSYEGGKVYMVNTSTSTVVNSLSVFSDFDQDITFNPSGSYAYATVYSYGADEDVLDTINTSTFTESNILYVGSAGDQEFFDIAVNPSGQFAYATTYGSSSVDIINLITNTLVTTLSVPGYAAGVTFNNAGTYAYVSGYQSGDLTVISTATNSISSEINLGGNDPYAAALNSAGTIAYVAAYGPSAVAIVNLASPPSVSGGIFNYYGISYPSPYSSASTPFVFTWRGEFTSTSGTSGTATTSGIGYTSTNSYVQGIASTYDKWYSYAAGDTGTDTGTLIGTASTSTDNFTVDYLGSSSLQAGVATGSAQSPSTWYSDTKSQGAYTNLLYGISTKSSSQGTIYLYWTWLMSYPPNGVYPTATVGTIKEE